LRLIYSSERKGYERKGKERKGKEYLKGVEKKECGSDGFMRKVERRQQPG